MFTLFESAIQSLSTCVEITYCARSFHLQGPIDHIIDDFLHTLSLLGVVAIIHDAGVEVSITNVSENAGEKI